jgi:hypothetical protein
VSRSFRKTTAVLWFSCLLFVLSFSVSCDERIQEIGAFTHILEQVKDAVVLVRATIDGSTGPSYDVSNGTGCVITSVGHILTTLHTVRDAHEITVVVGGREYSAVIEKELESKDVALLRLALTPAEPLPHLGVNPGCNLELLDDVLVAGFPHPPFIPTSQPTLAVGQVAAIRPEMSPNTVQLDLTSMEGMSGAPIVNEMGDVVGVLRSKLSGEHFGFGVLAAEFGEILPPGSTSRLLAPFNGAFGVGGTTLYGAAPKALVQFRLGQNAGFGLGLALRLGTDSWFSADGTLMLSLLSLYPGGAWVVSPFVGIGGGGIRVRYGSMQADSWWVHGAAGIQVRVQRALLSCRVLLTRPWGVLARVEQALYPVLELGALIDLRW